MSNLGVLSLFYKSLLIPHLRNWGFVNTFGNSLCFISSDIVASKALLVPHLGCASKDSSSLGTFTMLPFVWSFQRFMPYRVTNFKSSLNLNPDCGVCGMI